MADTLPKTTVSTSGTISGAGNIAVHDFTEAVFTGVLRAIDARKIGLPGKIIYGITYEPSELRAAASKAE